jgi:hypothetical protein
MRRRQYHDRAGKSGATCSLPESPFIYPNMRVHLSALMALVSATTYVACGSSDPSKTVQAGGAGGEGGDASSSGGSKNNVAGSQNGGGSKNNVGGAGGEPGASGGATAGAAGVSLGGESSGGMSSAGAGGEAGAPNDTGLPAACPGMLTDYVTLLGTPDDDSFTVQDVGGKKLIFGLDGADTFPTEHGGEDCLVGGPGDDDFTNSDEFANYYVGGAGADTYHLDTTGNYVRIADMEAGDHIALSQATFTFLSGVVGEPISSNQIHSVPGYSTGSPSGVIEGSSIIYDPLTGELWQDYDGGLKGSSVNDKQILTVLNHASYVFDVNDFLLD